MDSTDILKAIWRDQPEKVVQLLAKGAAVDGRDAYGRTPLMEVAISKAKLQFAETLLAHGADPHAADKAGWTALHFAAQELYLGAVELLLGAGAQVDAQDSHGNSPLSTAVFNCREVGGEIIGALRAAGADPYLANNYGQTPVGLARMITNYDVAKYFTDLPAAVE